MYARENRVREKGVWEKKKPERKESIWKIVKVKTQEEDKVR